MGVEISSIQQNRDTSAPVFSYNTNKKVIDMNGYKTPVLTENHIAVLEYEVNEIIIPKGTIITPGAKDLIKKRKLILTYKTN
jgi:hypothetical protein